MNREQKRALVKKAKKDGMSKDKAKTFAEIMDTGSHTKPIEIHNGDMVRINIDAVKARKNYEIMNPKYKEFIDASQGKVFTAHVERDVLVSLEEAPEWLFWCGDLIKERSDNV